MYSIIKEVDGYVADIQTNQYELGCYIIINSDPRLQFSSKLSERDYHIKTRIEAIKRGAKIIDGTVIPYRYKRYNINNFTSKQN